MSWFSPLARLFSQHAPRAAATQSVGGGVAMDMGSPAFLEFIRSGAASGSGAVEMALKNTTVWRACELVSASVGMLPISIKRVGANGALTVDDRHPLHSVLMFRPNAWQTPFEFKALMQFRALVYGDAYAAIARTGGSVVALQPIDPATVTPVQNADFTVSYRHTRKSGATQMLPSSDILHLRGMSLDGLNGLSRVGKAVEAIALAMSADRAAQAVFTHGVMAGGALSHPNKLSKEAHENLQSSLAAKAGAENRGKWIILEEGMKAETFTHSPIDSQQDETRKRQVEEIGRVFGIPRPLLGVDDTSWGSGIEQLSRLFVTYGLSPWFKIWEDALQLKCIDRSEWGKVRPDFDERDLLRGSMKDQAEFYAKALGSGGQMPWMTANEVREDVGLGARPEGEGLRQAGQQNTQGTKSDVTPQTP